MRRMSRTHRQPHETEPAQQLADRALGQLYAEALGDHRGKINAPPAHDAMFGKVGTADYQRGNGGLLLGRQAPGRTAAAKPVRQPGKALLVVAMHPVAQRLPVHATQTRRIAARMTVENQSERQHTPRCRTIAAARCRRAQARRVVVPPSDRNRHHSSTSISRGRESYPA